MPNEHVHTQPSASIVAYLRLVASRFQTFGYPEENGQAKADEMTDFLQKLSNDIEDSADRDER
jgi:hypothetical protein